VSVAGGGILMVTMGLQYLFGLAAFIGLITFNFPLLFGSLSVIVVIWVLHSALAAILPKK
jgi:hypothetical protein